MTGRKENATMAAARRGGKRKMPGSVRIGFLMILILAAVFVPTTILLSICLLPTFVAALVDYRPQKTAWLTVGALNFAGIVPSWFNLWQQGHTIDVAVDLLSRPETLLMAYGAAAAGWVLFLQVPPIVSSLLAGKADKRLNLIAKRQSELTRKWGSGVSGEQSAAVEKETDQKETPPPSE